MREYGLAAYDPKRPIPPVSAGVQLRFHLALNQTLDRAIAKPPHFFYGDADPPPGLNEIDFPETYRRMRRDYLEGLQ